MVSLEKEYWSVFTKEKEESLLCHIKNKNRQLIEFDNIKLFYIQKVLNKLELTRAMLNVLQVRKQAYRNLRGCHITKLSPNAQQAQVLLEALGFEISKVHHKKRRGTVSRNCALNCTKEMACNHLNKLAEELIKTNIFIDAIQLETGVFIYLFIYLFAL